MTQATYAALKLIRSTCDTLKQSVEPKQAEILGRVDIVLARLLAEQTTISDLKDRIDQEARQLLSTDGGHDFDSTMAQLDRLIENLDTSNATLGKPEVVKALQLDQQYWAEFGRLVKEQLATRTESDAQEETDFNLNGVESYLRAQFPASPELKITGYSLASLGYSKKTVLVTLANQGDLPAELAFRIDRPYNFLGTTVLDEFDVLAKMWQEGVKVPQPLALESTGDILGQPFIVFERAIGAPVGSNFTAPPKNEALVADFARNLARLHQVPVSRSGLPESKRDLDSNLDLEIEGSYRDWQQLGLNSPLMEAGFKWVRANRHLGSGPSTVVHNDYNFNNVLVHEGKLSAILDWEFVHVGHPAADLGYFYYSAEQTASFEHFLKEYEGAGGTIPASDVLDFYIFFGQLRLAVMVFQSEAGFLKGEFDDIRYGLPGALFLPISIDRVSRKLLELIEKSQS